MKGEEFSGWEAVPTLAGAGDQALHSAGPVQDYH